MSIAGLPQTIARSSVRSSGGSPSRLAYLLAHVCGADQRLDAYAGYPVDVVNWAPQLGNPSLVEVRRMLGKTVLGGLDQSGPLSTASRPAIEHEVREAVAAVGARGFMLGAGCAVTGEVDTEVFAWARDAAAA